MPDIAMIDANADPDPDAAMGPGSGSGSGANDDNAGNADNADNSRRKKDRARLAPGTNDVRDDLARQVRPQHVLRQEDRRV
jgi:hypothetical protein